MFATSDGTYNNKISQYFWKNPENCRSYRCNTNLTWTVISTSVESPWYLATYTLKQCSGVYPVCESPYAYTIQIK